MRSDLGTIVERLRPNPADPLLEDRYSGVLSPGNSQAEIDRFGLLVKNCKTIGL